MIADFLGPDPRVIPPFDADEDGLKCTQDSLARLSKRVSVKVADVGQYWKNRII